MGTDAMPQSSPHLTRNATQTALIAAFRQLFSKARRFYQHHAETTDHHNLRRHFCALAELHQHMLYLLPAAQSQCKALRAMTAWDELGAWYDNKRSPASLSTIQHQLVKQLQLQKAVIRKLDLGLYQHSLLHFTASLQIAADQLAEFSPR